MNFLWIHLIMNAPMSVDYFQSFNSKPIWWLFKKIHTLFSRYLFMSIRPSHFKYLLSIFLSLSKLGFLSCCCFAAISLMPCPSTWPKWFWSDQIDLDLTIMIWSRPKRIGQVQIVIFYQNEFWLWPNHYGQVQFNLVRPKPFWSDQNCFGHIEGQT